MFPLSFPFRRLIKAGVGDWVLDPFCGRGTTNYAARLHGLPSVGVDSNPVAACIAEAKVVLASSNEVVELCESILESSPPPKKVPVGEFWTTCYHPRTLADICRLREYLLANCGTPAEITLRALMLGVLHGPKTKGAPSYLSNQMPRTYSTKPSSAIRFWQKRGLLPEEVDVNDLVARRARYSLQSPPPAPEGVILNADSRCLSSMLNRYDFRWVITSPPYFGMRSYIPDQWLRYWFVGGPAEVTYSQVGQICHNEEQFISDLAEVWRQTADVCADGARLIVRFGALPSENNDPGELIKETLRRAQAGWRVRTVRNAGIPPAQRRQATQFKRTRSSPVEEIDVYARLEG